MKNLLKPNDLRLGKAAPLFNPYLTKTDLVVMQVRDRRTRSGDFRASQTTGVPHRITVNNGLSDEHFLIILAHEIAHFKVFTAYRKRIKPHGHEWKEEFGRMLSWLVNEGCFSNEVSELVTRHLRNPKASLSGDARLWLRLTEKRIPDGFMLLEEIPQMARFELTDGREFQKLERRRTRYTCREIHSGKLFWVSALAPARLLAS